MERKWLYFDTYFEDLACKLKEACEESGIKYEFSVCFDLIHGAFFVNEWERQYLNKVIEYNSICEQ